MFFMFQVMKVGKVHHTFYASPLGFACAVKLLHVNVLFHFFYRAHFSLFNSFAQRIGEQW